MIARRIVVKGDYVTLYFILQRMKMSLIINKKKLKKKAKIYKTLYKDKKMAIQLFLDSEKDSVTKYFNLLDKYKSFKYKFFLKQKIRLLTEYCRITNSKYVCNMITKYIKISISYNMVFKYNFCNLHNVKKIEELMGYKNEHKNG